MRNDNIALIVILVFAASVGYITARRDELFLFVVKLFSRKKPIKLESSLNEAGTIITQYALDCLGSLSDNRQLKIFFTYEYAIQLCRDRGHPCNIRFAQIHCRGLAKSLPFLRPALPPDASEGLPPESPIAVKIDHEKRIKLESPAIEAEDMAREGLDRLSMTRAEYAKHKLEQVNQTTKRLNRIKDAPQVERIVAKTNVGMRGEAKD